MSGAVRYRQRVLSCSALSFGGIVSRLPHLHFHFPSSSFRPTPIVGITTLTRPLASAQIIVAFSPSLYARLGGIALASFSSGLGEMTFFQLSTTYGRETGSTAVGWFSSGTGAAGLVGAGLWWVLRGLGVMRALLLCSVRRLHPFASCSVDWSTDPMSLTGFADTHVTYVYIATPASLFLRSHQSILSRA